MKRTQILGVALLLSCASTGDPPGGPPDTTPPRVVQVEPESGAVLTAPPREVNLLFDEVIAERIVGTPPDIAGAVVVSPARGEVRVGWHRDRISARPREGFQPGRIYRVELLPVVADLRQNRIRLGLTFVFSTGPPIPSARLTGTVVDWVAGRAAPRALVEAVLLPDSLPYRTLADSTGNFVMSLMPSGTYLVYGVMDTNGDHRRGAREAYDTVRIELSDTAATELYAFAHDTVGPRLRQVELRDSLTVRLTFDRPLDPAQRLDTTNVAIAPADDSTAHVALAGILTTRQLDSIVAASRPRPDTTRPATTQEARDTTRVGPDTSKVRREPGELRPTPAPRRPGAVPPAPAAAPATQPARRPAPLDSTRAERMLARRPSPSDVRLVRLTEPLMPEARFVVLVAGVRGLTGVAGAGRGQLRVPRPRTPPPASAPSPAPGSATPHDTLTTPPRDTLRPDTNGARRSAVRPSVGAWVRPPA